ncbi:MAG: hypothetical protein R3310_00225 [Candidatus Competibacteraceae bacterium]|nr:hypothetical protein [Candidatus Competibacteraceae bacterium]
MSQARGRLRAQLERLERAGRLRLTPAGELDPRFIRLGDWQAQRVARTHRDLVAHPRYRPAAEFFLEELYASRDFSDRDRGFARMYTSMVRILPDMVLDTVTDAMELNALTHELDAQMVEILFQEMGREQIDEACYAEAFRRGDLAARRRQLELIGRTGRELDRLVRLPLIPKALGLARVPARLAGLLELHRFLERGLLAFRHMNGAEEFLAIIQRREGQILERLASGAPEPFAVG